jgi:hypothetical protein
MLHQPSLSFTSLQSGSSSLLKIKSKNLDAQ